MEFLFSVIEDAAVIEPRLYGDYRSELLASAKPGEEVFLLQYGISNAINAFTLWEGITPLAIMGYYSNGMVLSGAIHPWLVGSKDLVQLPRVHFRVMRAFLGMLMENFGAIENFIRKDNIRGQRLLRAIGIEVSRDTGAVSSRGVELVQYRKFV